MAPVAYEVITIRQSSGVRKDGRECVRNGDTSHVRGRHSAFDDRGSRSHRYLSRGTFTNVFFDIRDGSANSIKSFVKASQKHVLSVCY